VLMANHVHLLVTPERAESLPRTMQDWHRDPISVLDEVPVENAACPAPQLNAVELLELSRVGRSAVLADAAATTAKRMRGVSGRAIIFVGTKPAILIPASKPCSTISTKLSSPQSSN